MRSVACVGRNTRLVKSQEIGKELSGMVFGGEGVDDGNGGMAG